MAYDIPVNQNSYLWSNWTQYTIKLPQIADIGTVFEMPAGWAQGIGLIAGRAKGFAGIGTVLRESVATVIFPRIFTYTPIVDITIIAPTGFSEFDNMGYNYRDTGKGYYELANTILFGGEDREQIYKNQRFVHKLRERRDVPLKVLLFDTNNGFLLQHSKNYFSKYSPYPFGDEHHPPKDFDGRVMDTVFIWHAFGV